MCGLALTGDHCGVDVSINRSVPGNPITSANNEVKNIDFGSYAVPIDG